MIDIRNCINELQNKRPLFVSEADFQLELAWTIKDKYPSAKVRCEYTPSFNSNMHIDILVILDGMWIPIELKYKTKGCNKEFDGDTYNLKNHGAKDVNCYLYLKDIQRIEEVRANVPAFEEGYTVFITNEESYLKRPQKQDCVYKDFSLAEGEIKKGKMDWAEGTGAGTKKGVEDPIILSSEYRVHWEKYSKIDDTNTGTFWYLANQIEK